MATPPHPLPSSELTSIAHLLHLAHHRNRNQHRLAKWWKTFSQFRRQVGKLSLELDALETCVRFSSSATAPVSGGEEKKKKKGTGKEKEGMGLGDGVGEEEGGGEKRYGKERERDGESKYVRAARETVEERVEFLERWVLPKCFIAFSNLVADNQYAALGLMLMGTLARLQTNLSGFGKGLEVEEEEENERGSLEALLQVEEGDGKDLSSETLRETDLGEVVSREQVFDMAEEDSSLQMKKSKKTRRQERTEGEAEGAARVGDGEGAMPAKRPRKKKKKGDTIDDLFAGLI